MSVETVLQEVEELVASFEKQRQELVDKLKPSFHEIFLPYLNKHPVVDHLHFTAYTPYFNDGEPCEYSVNDLYGTIVDEDGDELDDEFGWNYGANPNDLADFIETGKISTDLADNVKWYTQPSTRYEGYYPNRREIQVPPQFTDVAEAIRYKYASDIELGPDKLRKQALAVADFEPLRKTFGRIPDDVIQQLFGDGIKVVIKRDGVEVNEYDHD